MAERVTPSEKRLTAKIEELRLEVEKLSDALVGTDKSEGFFERVRRLENWTANQKANQKKAAWMIASLIITDIATRILPYAGK